MAHLWTQFGQRGCAARLSTQCSRVSSGWGCVQAATAGKHEQAAQQTSSKPERASAPTQVKTEQGENQERAAAKPAADPKKKKAAAKPGKMAGFGDLRSMFKKK
jgi:hypothetical protein